MIDIHSHILPGIDDGSKSFDESLDILKGLAEQGITDIIATPHFIAETNQTSSHSKNQRLLLELANRAKDININIYLGNEIYIDREIAKYLRTRRISPLADSKYLLIELPMSGEFAGYEDIFKSLQESGWTIILAHPERYHTVQKDYQIVKNLAKQGILLQCNLGSFIGQYGKHALKTAKHLAKDQLIFCFGTDIHRKRDYAEISLAQQKISKFYTPEEINTLFIENPKKIVQ